MDQCALKCLYQLPREYTAKLEAQKVKQDTAGLETNHEIMYISFWPSSYCDNTANTIVGTQALNMSAEIHQILFPPLDTSNE